MVLVGDDSGRERDVRHGGAQSSKLGGDISRKEIVGEIPYLVNKSRLSVTYKERKTKPRVLISPR